MEVEDPLKPLDSVMRPDPRCEYIVGTLEGTHDELAAIELSSNVPSDVRQLFETAKNVSLYSWFAFRLHPVAESVAFQALDMGLRARCATESAYPFRNAPPSFRRDLRYAADAGWIRAEGFSHLRTVGRQRAEMRASLEAIAANPLAVSLPVPSVSEEDIDRELASFDLVQDLVEGLPTIRNELAHGSRMVHPNSRRSLRIIADVLNQLFVI